MKLFIPWICYNHSVNMEHALAMMRLVLFCRDNNVPVSLYPIGFESLISRARNAAVAAFLSDPEATHLLFIDADIEFTPDDVFQMLFANKDIVCGAYAKKFLDRVRLPLFPDRLELCTHPSIHLSPGQPSPAHLMECEYATTGFLAIRRGVFDALRTRFPERAYKNDIDAFTSLDPATFYDFFPVTIHPETRRLESEDYGFSRLAREAGFKIHCVTHLTLTHHGVMGYPCNLWKQLSLAARTNPTDPAPEPPQP